MTSNQRSQTDQFIVMRVRTFQWTLGFWFTFAMLMGFFGGISAAALIHPW